MSLGGLIIVTIISLAVGLLMVFLLLKLVTDRLFRKMEALLKGVQVMVDTLKLQREDNGAMLLAAQIMRASNDERGIEPLPFEDKVPPKV